MRSLFLMLLTASHLAFAQEIIVLDEEDLDGAPAAEKVQPKKQPRKPTSPQGTNASQPEVVNPARTVNYSSSGGNELKEYGVNTEFKFKKDFVVPSGTLVSKYIINGRVTSTDMNSAFHVDLTSHPNYSANAETFFSNGTQAMNLPACLIVFQNKASSRRVIPAGTALYPTVYFENLALHEKFVVSKGNTRRLTYSYISKFFGDFPATGRAYDYYLLRLSVYGFEGHPTIHSIVCSMGVMLADFARSGRAVERFAPSTFSEINGALSEILTIQGFD